MDDLLASGLPRGALHEVYAASISDLSAALGFAVGLAKRATRSRGIVWVRQDIFDTEAGRLHPPGLAELGLNPAEVVLVRARDALGVLKAGVEATRCAALGAVLIELWGETRWFDLNASRRLSLAAQDSGVVSLVLRVGAKPQPSAAMTRWSVCALPSRPLPANAPGHPAFAVTLLRHRGGLPSREWCLEWNRDQGCFGSIGDSASPLSVPVVPASADRSVEAGEWRGRRTR